MPKRDGNRKTREQLSRRRVPELGYYYILTDTKETEKNYLDGLKRAIPPHLQGKLVIKLGGTRTAKLADEALAAVSSVEPQYREPWIVFDRDKVVGFDQIIAAAEASGVRAAWSNPCIEIWFNAYFGHMPAYQDSVACCRGFGEEYKRRTGQEYEKADAGIYEKLCRYGSEEQAITLAEAKYIEQLKNGNQTPSQMCPCTTVHRLVREIRGKFAQQENT